MGALVCQEILISETIIHLHIVKHVSIEYKDCSGVDRHISAEEYQQITL